MPRRMSGCDSRQPHQFPIRRAPACAAESPKLRLLGVAPRRRANYPGSWQTSNAPALQAGPSGSVTRRPPHFHRGENEIQASLISSVSVGATPTPATISGKCSDHPAVTRASLNLSEATAGALPALPTISGPVAQSAEQPVVCGKAEGASPFGSAISQRVA